MSPPIAGSARERVASAELDRLEALIGTSGVASNANNMWLSFGMGVAKGSTLRALIDGARASVPSADAQVEALRALEASGLWWHIAKGRTRPDEPLYGAEIVDPENGADTLSVAEAENMADAIADALAKADHPVASAALSALSATKPEPAGDGEGAQPYKDALHDLVMLRAQDEIGCVPPPTKDQWTKAWAEAVDLVRVEP